MSEELIHYYVGMAVRQIAAPYGEVVSLGFGEGGRYWLNVRWPGGLGGSMIPLPIITAETTINAWEREVGVLLRQAYDRMVTPFARPQHNILPAQNVMSPNAAMERRARDYNPPIVCEDDSGNEKSYQSPDEWYEEVRKYLKKKEKPGLATMLWTVA